MDLLELLRAIAQLIKNPGMDALTMLTLLAVAVGVILVTIKRLS